jgi:hypothetical protein
MISDKKKVVYYILGTIALVSGIYMIADKDEVKRGLEWIKNSIKVNNKSKDNGK